MSHFIWETIITNRLISIKKRYHLLVSSLIFIICIYIHTSIRIIYIQICVIIFTNKLNYLYLQVLLFIQGIRTIICVFYNYTSLNELKYDST